MKRLLAILLVLATALTNVSVLASEEQPYSPGIYEYTQDLTQAVELNNASAAADGLTIEAGGRAVYDFTLPFDAAKLTVDYAATQDTELKVKTERAEYSAALSRTENAKVIDLANERMGAFLITFEASAPVTITKLHYTKVEAENGGHDSRYLIALEYEDLYEEALRSTVIIPENSNTIKVKNALRRVNMDDATVATKIVDGKLYAPIDTFAHALGMYFENYTDLKYGYMSGETFAWCYKDGISWYEDAGRRADMKNMPVYIEDILYVPVREIAEAAGYNVDYREGIAAIGMRTEVKNILWNEEIYAQLDKEMDVFVTDGTPAIGKEYHVSVNGNDENAGMEDSPFATIQKAADVAMAGDTVIVHEGTYRESVTFKNDGTELAPITFKAADGENVVISAFEEVSGFTPYTNPANNVAMYKTDVSNLEFEISDLGTWTDDRNFIIYENKTLLEGRHPNSETSTEKTEERWNGTIENEDGTMGAYEEFTYKKVSPFNPYYPDLETNEIMPTRGDIRFRDMQPKGEHKVYYHEATSDVDLNQETPNYWKGATIMAFIGYAWQLSPAVVDSSEKGKLVIADDWHGTYGPTYYVKRYATDYAYLTHHLNTVDMPGEWYLDNSTNTLYVIPPTDAYAETFTPEVKARQLVMDLTGRKYVQIQNINSQGGGMTMDDAEGCILNGGKHRYISQYDKSSIHDLNGANFYHKNLGGYTSPDDDDAPEFGEVGFYIGGQNNAIVNTDIEYSAGAGILVTGKYNYIYNNMVDKTGFGGTYLGGIYITQKMSEQYTKPKKIVGGHTLYNNTSYGAYRAALGLYYGRTEKEYLGDVKPVAALDIAYNEWAWSNIAARDTGQQYFAWMIGGDDQEPTKYHHNVMHDAVGPRTDSIMSANLYIDGGVAAVNSYDNICYSTGADDVYRSHQYFYWDGYLGKDLGFAWANWSDEYGHEDGMEYNTTIWPNGLAFKAGKAQDGDERFMDNYNNVQRDDIIMLGNGTTLTGNTYVDEDNYVVIPDTESTIEGTLTMGEDGTIVSVYYSEDMYGKGIDTCPYLTLELYSGDELVYHKETIVAAFGRYMDSGSKINFHIPNYVDGEVKFVIRTDKDTMRFRKLAATDFDYMTENSKRDFPYDALPIILGDVDEIIHVGENTKPSVVMSLNEAAVENHSYAALKDTWDSDFVYKDKVITHEMENVVYVIGSNYTYSNILIKINATNKETGETKEIGYVDCSESFKQGIAWHTENVKGVLYEPLQPGTYDFYLDFGIAKPTSETEPRTVGSGDTKAMVFF